MIHSMSRNGEREWVIVPAANNNNDNKEDYAFREAPMTSYASLEQSKTSLGSEPQVSLHQGLEQTLA
jgi:hypothetical protein